YARRVPRDEVRTELRRQLDAFEQALGRAPDFVDGHHHAQQLPGVRDVMVEDLRARGPSRPWVRTCAEGIGPILRRGVARARALSFAFPGRGLRRLLDREGL